MEPLAGGSDDLGQSFHAALLSASAQLLGGLTSYAPVVLLVDDAEAAILELRNLLSAFPSSSFNNTRIIAAVESIEASNSLGFESEALVLGPISRVQLQRLVAQELNEPLAACEPIANTLFPQVQRTPMAAVATLRAASEREWIERVDGALRFVSDSLSQLSDLSNQPHSLINDPAVAGMPLDKLRRAALLGPRTSQSDARIVLAIAKEDFSEAVSKGQQAGLFHLSDGELRLRGFARRVVLEGVSEAEQRELHDKMASSCLALGASATVGAYHIVHGTMRAEHPAVVQQVLIEAAQLLMHDHADSAAEPIVEALARALRSGWAPGEHETAARLVVAHWAARRKDFELFEEVAQLPAGATALERGRLSVLVVTVNTVRDRFEEALEFGRAGLRELGAELGEGPKLTEVLQRIRKRADPIGDRTCTHAESTCRQQLLQALIAPTYGRFSATHADVVAALVSETLEFGLTPQSTEGIASLALLASAMPFSTDLAEQLGERALELVTERSGHTGLAAVCFVVANFVFPACGRLEETNALNQMGLDAADARGDGQYGVYLRSTDVLNRLLWSDRLPQLNARLDRYQARTNASMSAIAGIESIQAVVRHLAADVYTPLAEDSLPTERLFPRLIYHIGRTIASLVLGDHDALKRHWMAAAPLLERTKGWTVPEVYHTYVGGLIAHYEGDAQALGVYCETLQTLGRRIEQLQPLVLHLCALATSQTSESNDALMLFERAVKTARYFDDLGLAAITAEHAARYAQDHDLSELAASFQQRAAQAYWEWGVRWKAAALGHGAAVEGATRSNAPMLRFETDFDSAETVAQDALLAMTDSIRDASGAERVQVYVLHHSDLLGVLESDGLRLHANRLTGTSSAERRSPSDVYRAANDLIASNSDGATVVPLPAKGYTLVARLFGATREEPDRNDLVDALARMVPWVRLWNSELNERDRVSVLARVIEGLGPASFFLGYDGLARLTDGEAVRVPDVIVEATQRAQSEGCVVKLQTSWPPGQDRLHRLIGIPCPELTELRPDVEPIVWLAEDLTLARLEQQAQRTTAEVGLIRQLASGLSHDISNVAMIMELLARQAKAGTPYATAAADAVAKTQRLARRVTALATDRPTPLDIAPLNLGEYLLASAALFGRMTVEKVRLQVGEVADDTWVLADIGAVDRILLNLIINAKQALEGRGGTITLAVSDSGPSEVALEVRDDGPGIPEELLSGVFEHGVSSKRSSGIGLSVVQYEAQLMGANISVHSAIGDGTVFRLVLPRCDRPSDRATAP